MDLWAVRQIDKSNCRLPEYQERVRYLKHLTAGNFLQETKKTPLPAVVMFYADWCGKCAMMKPIVEEIEKRYRGRVRFFEAEIEESAPLAAEYEADLVPTFVYFQNGKVVGRQQGPAEESTFEAYLRKVFHTENLHK